MREARRLALLERQRMIADLSRKQALRGLAEAIEAEARGAALAERSLRLVAASAPGTGATSGVALQARAAFTAGLAQLAVHAQESARDARRQSAWASEALAQAETRARRLDELTTAACGALAAARERREQAHAPPLARKLHNRR